MDHHVYSVGLAVLGLVIAILDFLVGPVRLQILDSSLSARIQTLHDRSLAPLAGKYRIWARSDSPGNESADKACLLVLFAVLCPGLVFFALINRLSEPDLLGVTLVGLAAGVTFPLAFVLFWFLEKVFYYMMMWSLSSIALGARFVSLALRRLPSHVLGAAGIIVAVMSLVDLLQG